MRFFGLNSPSPSFCCMPILKLKHAKLKYAVGSLGLTSQSAKIISIDREIVAIDRYR
jgi:hypothetical protein